MVYFSEINATAIAEMPSPRPVKPRCSSVVAFTLTQPSGTPIASARRKRISGMYGMSLGRCATIVASVLTISQP